MIAYVRMQEPPAIRPLTLDDAVREAIQKSASVRIAQRSAQASGRRADEIAAGLKPGLAASANALRFDQATRIQFDPNAAPFVALPEHTETLGLTLTQRLDLFGQIRTAVGQARLQSLADTFAAQTALRAKRLQVATAFFGLLKARDQQTIAAAAETAARTQQTQAQALYDAGVGQKVDLLRANTAAARAVQRVEAARAGEESARAVFNDALKRPLDAPVELAAPAIGPGLPEIAAAEERAAHRDDVLQAETLARAAALDVTLAHGEDKPTVALQATGNYYPTPSFQTPRQRTAGIGVSINIPLADGGRSRARADEARLRQENAQGQAGIVRGNAVLEARQAYLNLRTALKQIDAARAVAEQARAARDLAQTRYAGQVGLFLEWIDAQSALTDAEAAASDALYDYQLARARFESATGGETHA